MKKLLCGSLIALGLISGANATDLISLATNGKANESSLGVKALSNQEMNEIVGGAYIYGNPVHQYGKKNNSGAKISYTAYYDFTTTLNERYKPAELVAIGRLNVDDGSGKYKPVVQATYNHSTNQVSISIIGMNQYNPVYTRPADRYYADELIKSNGRELFQSVDKQIRNDASKYWSSNYRGKYTR